MSRILAFLLLLILPAHACLWDRDTLQEEAKGKLDTVRALTGWFDRYPSRYYEMRLERVTAELASNPSDLNLYDDVGVACSRLGHHDEAIAWMAKKKTQLDQLPEAGPADDRYRYLSNLGTFHLIRWITTPEQDRYRDLADLRISEDLVAKAIALNPDAHFGREKYQLILIQWLLDPNLETKFSDNANFLRIDTRHNNGRNSVGIPGTDILFADATKGITGLIQLGAAWQSIDTAYALQTSLCGQGNNYVAELASLRRQQLVGQGAVSLHPSDEIRDYVAKAGASGMIYEPREIATFFKKATAAAAQRETAWLAYQEERFAKGMHPDTHAEFWNAWHEPEFPKFPAPSLGGYMTRNPGMPVLIFLGTLATLILAAIIAYIRARTKRRRRSLPVTA
jgi:tetratricopeptide (TPR) repeat protein